MNRPPDVTEEMVNCWEERRQEWLKTNPDFGEVYPKEAFYSGEYMGRSLHSLGCPPERIEQILIAAGQRQSGRQDDDMWRIAAHVVEEYKQGRWESPGPELAQKILKERYGEDPDPLALFGALADIVPDKGVFLEKMLVARYTTAYG